MQDNTTSIADLKLAIESVLFMQGEPMPLARLAKIIGEKPSAVASALRELIEEYRERGINILVNDDAYQFVTNPEAKPVVEKFLASDLAEGLTKTSLEVLAIVAYKGPMSRAAIEYIRGVDSSFSLRNLLMRGLVSREEGSDRRGYIYRISTDFLKHLGARSIAELPHYAEFHKTEISIPDENAATADE